MSPSRATRAANEGGATVTPIGTAAEPPPATPEPAPKPTAGVEAYAKTFYRPTVNGQPVECLHDPAKGKYGHDSEKAAMQCAKHLAAATAS